MITLVLESIVLVLLSFAVGAGVTYAVLRLRLTQPTVTDSSEGERP